MLQKKMKPDMLGKIVPPMAAYDYFDQYGSVPLEAVPDFSPGTSAWMAELSLLAYEEPNFVRNILRFTGFPDTRFFQNKSTEAFVASNDGLVVVFFRGTEVKSVRSILDVYTDASFRRCEFLGGTVHSGFRDGLLDVWNVGVKIEGWAPWVKVSGMLNYLLELKNEKPGRKFLFTGHSLGAALATLAASQFPDATALYTFGSPMVGDASFASSLRVPHYRWVNNRDAVTYLPPPELMERLVKYSYVHSGVEKFIDETGKLGTPPEDRQLLSNINADIDKVLDGIATAFSSVSAFKGMLGKVTGGAKMESKPVVDIMVDHAPINYAVNVWNQLCP